MAQHFTRSCVTKNLYSSQNCENVSPFKIFYTFIVCMCVCTCAQKHTWLGRCTYAKSGVRGHRARWLSPLPHRLQELELRLPGSPAKPSHQAIHFQLSNILRGHYKHTKIYTSSRISPCVPLIQLHQQSTFIQSCFNYARVINGLSSSKSLIEFYFICKYFII